MKTAGKHFWFKAALLASAWFMLAVVLLLTLPGGTSQVPEIRVGLYENEPKIFSDERGRAQGFFAVLLQEIARREGFTLQWVHCEWQQCLQMLAAQELDLMPDVAWSEERAELFDFHSIAVSQAWSHIYTAQLDTIPRSFEDLHGQRVALLGGAIQEAELADLLLAGSSYIPVTASSQLEVFQLLRDGAADFAVANNFSGSRMSSVFGLYESPLVFNQSSLYYAAAPGRHAELLALIDNTLLEWRADPQSIYYQALSAAMTMPPERIVPLWLRSALLSALLLAALLLFFNQALRWRIRTGTEDLRATTQRLEHLLESSPVIIYSLRPEDLSLSWISANIERLLGFSPRDALAPHWWSRQLHYDDRSQAIRMLKRIKQDYQVRHEYRLLDASGKVHNIRDELRLIPGEPGKEDEIVGSLTDMTSVYEHERRVNFLASFDTLTGLANRAQLIRELEVKMTMCREEALQLALVFIDLDRFKNINDSLGTVTGDRILMECARRIVNVRDRSMLAARLGADDFCLCLVQNQEQGQGLETELQALLAAISEPVTVRSEAIVVTASIGVCMYPQAGGDAEELMGMAEQAMVAAKARGGNCFEYYHKQLRHNTRQRFQLENDLRKALAKRELFLHYQPQIDLRSGRLVGLEALLRWQHGKHGMIPPGQFIPVAEESGIIFELDVWVMGEACRQLRAWERIGLEVPLVAVNITAAELESSSLIDNVREALQLSGLRPERLELEITESMLMEAPQRAIEVLGKINDLGVRVAMDDFGTGYSNLAHLGSLPLDRLKLDQSFVHDIGRSPRNESIIRAIITMAGAMQLSIIAEGVETEAQAVFLRQQGCEIAQGYLYAHPQDAEALYPLLSSLLNIPAVSAQDASLS